MYLRTHYIERKMEKEISLCQELLSIYIGKIFSFFSFFFLSQKPIEHIVTIINISHTFHSKPLKYYIYTIVLSNI